MDKNTGENKNVDRKAVAAKLLRFFPLFDQRFMRPILRQSGLALSPMQMHTLFIVNDQGTITRTELANELDISKQQLTPIINKLVDSGLLERVKNPANKRLVQLKLSLEGENTMRKHKEKTLQMLMEKLDFLDAKEALKLENTLSDLYRILFKVL